MFYRKLIMIVGILMAGLFAGCTQIDTGNVGIKSVLGKVDLEELPPGIYFTMFKTVKEKTTKEIVVSQENLKPKSKDNLTMEDIDVDIYYQVKPEKVADLSIKYQGDEGVTSNGVGTVGENRVFREARESIFRAVALFEATSMHTQREELGEKIRSILQKELDASDPDTFSVTTVNVKSLQTDKAIENAIREQIRMDQAIAKNLKARVLAESEKERRKIEAESTAQANMIISASMTGPIKEIRLAEIQRDTAIALASKAGNTVLMGNSVPLIGVK